MDAIIMDMGDDIKGESSKPGFENKIELISFSHGGRTPGKRDPENMTVTKYFDTVSPLLHRATMEGKVFPRVDLIIGRNDAGRLVVVLRYTLKNVLISSITLGGSEPGALVETLTLDFNSITWDYS